MCFFLRYFEFLNLKGRRMLLNFLFLFLQVTLNSGQSTEWATKQVNSLDQLIQFVPEGTAAGGVEGEFYCPPLEKTRGTFAKPDNILHGSFEKVLKDLKPNSLRKYGETAETLGYSYLHYPIEFASCAHGFKSEESLECIRPAEKRVVWFYTRQDHNGAFTITNTKTVGKLRNADGSYLISGQVPKYLHDPESVYISELCNILSCFEYNNYDVILRSVGTLDDMVDTLNYFEGDNILDTVRFDAHGSAMGLVLSDSFVLTAVHDEFEPFWNSVKRKLKSGGVGSIVLNACQTCSASNQANLQEVYFRDYTKSFNKETGSKLVQVANIEKLGYPHSVHEFREGGVLRAGMATIPKVHITDTFHEIKLMSDQVQCKEEHSIYDFFTEIRIKMTDVPILGFETESFQGDSVVGDNFETNPKCIPMPKSQEGRSGKKRMDRHGNDSFVIFYHLSSIPTCDDLSAHPLVDPDHVELCLGSCEEAAGDYRIWGTKSCMRFGAPTTKTIPLGKCQIRKASAFRGSANEFRAICIVSRRREGFVKPPKLIDTSDGDRFLKEKMEEMEKPGEDKSAPNPESAPVIEMRTTGEDESGPVIEEVIEEVD
eukprot:g4783.t1